MLAGPRQRAFPPLIYVSVSSELPGAPSNLVISNISPRSATLQFRPGYDGKTSISKWIVEGQVCPRQKALSEVSEGLKRVWVANCCLDYSFCLTLDPSSPVRGSCSGGPGRVGMGGSCRGLAEKWLCGGQGEKGHMNAVTSWEQKKNLIYDIYV